MSDFKQLLDTFSAVASVIKTIAETPGINMLPYATSVSGAISAIEAGVAVGSKVSSHIAALKETFSSGVPSQENLDALDARIAELRVKLHTMLPEKEANEPD